MNRMMYLIKSWFRASHHSMLEDALQHAQRVEQAHEWGRVVWHVWRQGTASKPPLVLLHGGSGSWTHWVRNVQHLALRYEVWALDIPGFGDSSLPPQARDADDLVTTLGEILCTTFGDQAVPVMGFSFGGMLAGLLAATQPQCISKLILVGAPGLGLTHKPLNMRGLLPEMNKSQRRAVYRHNLRALMLAHDASINDEVLDLQQANVMRDRLRRRRISSTNVLAKAQSAWQCPVHGVWGEGDVLYQGTLQQIPDVLHRLDSFNVVPDAGHWVMFERSEAFHAVIDALL